VLQRASLLGQLVFDAHRRFGDDDPGEDSLGFELAQPLRQHPIADVGNRAAQLGETHPPVQQQLNHGSGPAAPDELDGPMESGAELGFEAHTQILAQKPT
jgi:hypothetical protein